MGGFSAELDLGNAVSSKAGLITGYLLSNS